MAAFSFPADPTLGQLHEQPDGTDYIWNGYAWIAQGPVNVETLEERVIALETDIVKKISQGDDAILNSVRSLTEVMADGRVIAGFEVGREYNTSATIFFMDVVATAELLPEIIGRANYEGTFYFGDPRDAIPAVPPDVDVDGNPIDGTGSPEVPAYPGGSVHTSGLVASYQYQVPGTYQITFTPDNPESTPVSGLEVTAIGRTGYTISPSVRFDKCDLSLSPAMSGTYHMGDGQAYQAPQPEVPPTTDPDTGEVIDPGSPAVPELPEIAEGVITSDANGAATYYYERAGDFTVRFTPDDLNADVTAGVSITMPTFYTITASRDDTIANMSVSPDLPGTYYFGDGLDAIPEVPAVYAPHITATPDRVDNQDGTFSPGTAYAWTFTIEGGVDGVWNYGDENSTADATGAFTYAAPGTYEVSFTRGSDNQVSNLSLVVADGDVDTQTSTDQVISEAIPEVPAVPQGEIVYDLSAPVTYTYPREGTFTIRFAPADGNDNPTTEFISHVSVPYVISSPEYFMYKALTLSPTCGGYYTMGDGLAVVPEVPATYKNRITATPDASDPPVPYMFNFSIENSPAGSYSYGDVDGTVNTDGVFTYPGVGTYTVTFTADETSIVSNLTLVVSDLPESQTGSLEELTPYVPEVPAVPEGRVDTTDGTAEYTYPREGDFTITFYPNELSKPVSLDVNCVQRKTYTLTSSRDERTATLTSTPALPGVYHFGDYVPAIPEVPAVYKKHIVATPAYDPVPLTFIFDTGAAGTYTFGDAESTTDDSPNGASEMIYTAAGDYTVTFTETSTGAVSTMTLTVPDVDPVAQTSPDEILTDAIPEVPAIEEGTLVSADGTGTYEYAREGTFTITYVPDDHNYNATTEFISHNSVPYVISSPEYFLYKSLSLDPVCGGYYMMGDAVPEVVGVYKAHIIATPAADNSLSFTFTNDGTTRFSRLGRKLRAAKPGKSAGVYSYGDVDGTVNADGVFTYPAAGTYTVTFTNDADGAVSTLTLTVLDTGSIEQVSDNEWLVVPEPAIPEGRVDTANGVAEYTYARNGDYTITFYPDELSKPVTLGVNAVARTDYSIVAMRDERTATLASAPALAGTYYFGDAQPAIPEVPATYGLQMTATPDYDNGQWKFNFSNNKGIGGMYAFGDDASSTFLSADGNATFTYPAAASVTVSFMASDDTMVMITPMDVPDADPVAQSSPTVELTPAVPEVPAVPEGTLTTADGTGTYDYLIDGTFTIRYVPDDHNYEATTTFVSHTSVPYVITPTPTYLNVSLALDIPCGGTYYFGDAVDAVTNPDTGAEISPAIPQGSLETTDGTGTYAYRAAGTYTISFHPNELSKPVSADVTVEDPPPPPPPIDYILDVAMSGLTANITVTQ